MADFFAMGGYGFYVWMSMGMALLLIIVEIMSLRLGHKNVLKQIRQMVAMNKAQQTRNKPSS